MTSRATRIVISIAIAIGLQRLLSWELRPSGDVEIGTSVGVGRKVTSIGRR